MVQTPKPPASKPARKPRRAATDVKAPTSPAAETATTLAPSRADDSLHCAKLTVVAPSCAQNVCWLPHRPGSPDKRGRRHRYGWPLCSPHACLNCCHTFEGPPVGMPTCYDDRTDGFFLWGNFCSFSCCKRHILETKGASCSRLIDNLALLAIKVHKENVRLRVAPKHYRGVRIAPPRTALKMFGGGMTIEEFRADSVRVTELLAKEPFVKMTWPDALVAVKGNLPAKTKGVGADQLAPPRPAFAVGRANPVRRKHTLDAFLRT